MRMTLAKSAARASAPGCVSPLALLAVVLPALGAASSPVADAAMKRDLAAVRLLISQKADVNASQPDGATALQWAAHLGDLDMAGVLIEAGADVKIANREGATALFLACETGNAAMIGKLLNAGADANERWPGGDTPLMMASRSGNLAAMKLLLDHKADINAKELMRGTTALMWATEQNHPAAVRLLVEHGADVAAITGSAKVATTAYLAPTVRKRTTPAGAPAAGAAGRAGPARGGAPGGGAPVGQDGQTGQNGQNPAAPAVAGFNGIDFAALAALDPAEIARLDPAILAAALQGLNEGAASFFSGPPNDKGGGLTALVIAARENCMECAAILMDGGANVNQTTRYGWTALMTAVQNRNYKLASFLLDQGADPNIANKGGWTPLYLATDNRNIEGGDYPVPSADMDHFEIIKKLLDHGANVNARICGTESTPAQCRGDSTETRTNFTMQWLTEAGATAFLRASQSGDTKLMKLLLEHGADPKISTGLKVTPLMVASGIGWVEGVTFEWSPEESVEAVKMLLDLGLDVNAASDEGRTALHGAAHKGRNAVVQLLVDHGADLAARDFGSRDTGNGDMFGRTWIALNYAEGLVRVGVQSAIPHPETAALIRKLMAERGLEVPPPISSSICITQACKGETQ
jgi:ankyrin repeat protein